MSPDYLQRQSADRPLFPDLLWSRPENRLHAGKLLVVGGNAHGFAAPALAFGEAEKAGIGSQRVLLPEHVRKLLPKGFFEADFAASTPSGSFAKQALPDLLEHAAWADTVLLAGDLGRNSETAIVLEQFMAKYDGALVITQDAADYVLHMPPDLLGRPATILVISFAQLRRLGMAHKWTRAFTYDMDFVPFVEALHEFSLHTPTAIVVKHHQNIFVASNGQVSATALATDLPVWRVATAAHVAVWWLQNPGQTFEAVTTSLLQPAAQ